MVKKSKNPLDELKIKPPAKGAFEIETEEHYPKLHTLTIASGKRGGGKSVGVANYVSACLKKGYFDKVWCITPTYASNKEIWNMVPIEEENVFEPTKTCMKELADLVMKEREAWEQFLSLKEQYEQYLKDMKDKKLDLSDKNVLDRLLEYEEHKFFDDKPVWMYRNEVPPRLAVIIDDCVGSDLMRLPSSNLVNTCIKHRHLGDGLGLSMFMLVQSYACREGVPRAIRENCTHLMLFRIAQEQQIKKVFEEADLDMSYEEFYGIIKEVHEEPFAFFFMDFAPKKPEYRFRKNFDEFIIPTTSASDDHRK